MLRRLSELVLPALVLGVLLIFTFARFYLISYIGFQYNGATGRVNGIVDPDFQGSLFPGDYIREVNGEPWSEFPVSHRINPLAIAQTGETLTLLVESESGQKEVEWQVPGFSSDEFFSRLVNTWALGYVFWLAGTITLILVRPRDLRWGLLIALNYVTAIWLLAGSMSYSGLLESAFVLRAGVWMSLPIYPHFHYNFPRPMGPPHTRFWIGLYLLSAGLAAAQWFEWLPSSAYLLALGGAVGGSVSILVYRYVSRKGERREIGLLVFAVAVALLPTLIVAVGAGQDNSSIALPGYLLSMLALPGAYLYVVYRRQLGGLEFRANQVVSIYLFLVLLAILGLLVIPIFSNYVPELSESAFSIVVTALVSSVLSIFAFPRFQTFVERRLLGIPQPAQHVLENFAGRISTSFSYDHLADILLKEVLPSLLVRQSALLDFTGKNLPGRPVYLQAVRHAELPRASSIHLLLAEKVHIVPVEVSSQLGAGWVKVALTLTVAGEPRGVWLLGRKDPDDFYSQAELNLLRSLADQMAIALANISQAQSLRALHQADIERQEVERVHLARELHDDVLHRISELGHQVDDAQYAKGFGKTLEGLIGQVRLLINGLRPPLMDQGLYFALQSLANELAQKPPTKTKIEFTLAHSAERFDPMVEQHLYRIIQQACENALEHSHAKHISIQGRLEKDRVDLLVEDDGKGFKLNEQNDLAEFLATRHFGLAGMEERAAMIDAKLLVDTAPGKGTRIRLTWRKGDLKGPNDT